MKKICVIGAAVAVSLGAAARDTRLADAAERGDRAAVQQLIRSGADVNAAQGDGTTALHWAAAKEDAEMAKMLLAAGASVKAMTREGGMTPLIMASMSGAADVIEALIAAGADVNTAKSAGTTPLMLAAGSGKVDAVKALLDHGASLNAKEASHGQTALMFAAGMGRGDVIRLMLQRGADPGVTTEVRKLAGVRLDANGELISADSKPAEAKSAEPKAPEVATKPSAPGAPAAAQQRPRELGATIMGGMTALVIAARDGQRDAAKALIEGGADINQASAAELMTPLVMAISNGHFDLAKYLVQQGADVNKASVAGLTPLYATIDLRWAPKSWVPMPVYDQEEIGYMELMKLLIDRGANVNARLGKRLWFRSFFSDQSWVDPAGATPFWRAAQSSDVAAMKFLVAHGADAKMATLEGDTPLMVAAGLGWGANFTVNAPDSWLAAVGYCLQLGNEVNAVDSRGYTALHGVGFRGDNEMVKYLVAKGARTSVRTKAGDYPADMANGPIPHSLPHPDTVALLESLGSPNSHNCRSDQCVVAPKEDKPKTETPASPGSDKPPVNPR
jgi:ankyrin repeat protein